MRAVPGSEECLRPGQARAGSGGDSEQLVCAGGTEREKVETGAQGGADTEELSIPSGSEG